MELNADHAIISDRNRLAQVREQLVNATERYMVRKQFDLEMAEKTNQLSNPQRILERGFSITMKGSQNYKKHIRPKTGRYHYN